MSDRYDAQKVLAKQIETNRRLAESQAPSTIGQAVLELVRRDGDASVSTLAAMFEQRLAAIDAKPGSEGIDHMLAEAALAALRAAQSALKQSE